MAFSEDRVCIRTFFAPPASYSMVIPIIRVSSRPPVPCFPYAGIPRACSIHLGESIGRQDFTEEGFLPWKETREEDIWTHSLAFTSEVKTLLNVTQMSVLKETESVHGDCFEEREKKVCFRRKG